MGMPSRIVFVRHGESEANVVQGRDKRGEDVDTSEAEAIRQRIDYKQRLSKLGIE
jgi:broad specificity phosphatase PhoE